MPPSSRRAFLAATAGTIAGAFAGCSSDGGDDTPKVTPATETDTPLGTPFERTIQVNTTIERGSGRVYPLPYFRRDSTLDYTLAPGTPGETAIDVYVFGNRGAREIYRQFVEAERPEDRPSASPYGINGSTRLDVKGFVENSDTLRGGKYFFVIDYSDYAAKETAATVSESDPEKIEVRGNVSLRSGVEIMGRPG